MKTNPNYIVASVVLLTLATIAALVALPLIGTSTQVENTSSRILIIIPTVVTALFALLKATDANATAEQTHETTRDIVAQVQSVKTLVDGHQSAITAMVSQSNAIVAQMAAKLPDAPAVLPVADVGSRPYPITIVPNRKDGNP